MHTLSIIENAYRFHLNLHMEAGLYLASPGIMELKPSWGETVRMRVIFGDIARLLPICYFLKIGLFVFPVCTSSAG